MLIQLWGSLEHVKVVPLSLSLRKWTLAKSGRGQNPTVGKQGDTTRCESVRILQVDNPVQFEAGSEDGNCAVLHYLGWYTRFCFTSYAVFYLWNSLQSSSCGIFYSLDFMYLYTYTRKGPSLASFLFGASDLPMTISFSAGTDGWRVYGAFTRNFCDS